MVTTTGLVSYAQIPDPLVVVQPTVEPITLAEAKKQCEVSDANTAHDDYIQSLISVGRAMVEKETGLSLVDQTWEMWLDAYPESNVIPLIGPFLSLVAFQYRDEDGNMQTIDSDEFLIEGGVKSRYPKLVTRSGVTWPTNLAQANTVLVQWRAGFVDRLGSPTEGVTLIPAPLRHAVKFLVSHLFENREPVSIGSTVSELPMTVKYLCSSYRVSFGMA